MASTYSSRLRLELMADGDQTGNWGATTNRNLGTLLEQSIAGATSIPLADANYTLSASNGAQDESRSAILIVEGASLATRDVIIPAVTKTYVVSNFSTGNQTIRIKTASGQPATVGNGVTAYVYCDGVDTTLISSNQTTASGTVTAVVAQAPLTGGTITGSGTIGLETVSTLTPGRYGDPSNIPTFTVDVYGRITSASSVSISGSIGTGTVTRIVAGTGLNGGVITSSGTISLATTGINSGSYGSETKVPVLTLDVYGRVVGVTEKSANFASTSISNGASNYVSAKTTGIDIVSGGGQLSITCNSGAVFSGNISAQQTLSVNGSTYLNGSTFVVDATSWTTKGDIRILGASSSSSQILRVGAAAGTANQVLLSTNGSNVRGVMWDGSNLIVGRGALGGSSNTISFAGDTTSGIATFSSGNVFKPGGGSFSASSDERLKDIHGVYKLGLDAVMELLPIEFNYKNKPDDRYIGLSAQRTEFTQLSSMVRVKSDGYLAIDNSELIYTLVNAVKELNMKIQNLEMRDGE